MIFPFFGMMILTFIVMGLMGYRRAQFVKAGGLVGKSHLSTVELEKQAPKGVQTAGQNFRNLFELPVIFYAVILFNLAQGQNAWALTLFANIFLIARIGHSYVHCTYNKLSHRFALFTVSASALIALICTSIAYAL